jgi:hypothetical protein
MGESCSERMLTEDRGNKLLPLASRGSGIWIEPVTSRLFKAGLAPGEDIVRAGVVCSCERF